MVGDVEETASGVDKVNSGQQHYPRRVAAAKTF
jgi:hypothetical protein